MNNEKSFNEKPFILGAATLLIYTIVTYIGLEKEFLINEEAAFPEMWFCLYSVFTFVFAGACATEACGRDNHDEDGFYNPVMVILVYSPAMFVLAGCLPFLAIHHLIKRLRK